MTQEAEQTLIREQAGDQQAGPNFYTQLFKDIESINEEYDLIIRELLLDHFLPIETDY